MICHVFLPPCVFGRWSRGLNFNLLWQNNRSTNLSPSVMALFGKEGGSTVSDGFVSLVIRHPLYTLHMSNELSIEPAPLNTILCL